MSYFASWTPLSANEKTLQSHIHLSPTENEVANIGNSAHHLTQFPARERISQPKIILSLHRSLNHHLHVHVANSFGNVLQLTDYAFTVICKPEYQYTAYERLQQLLGMNGRVVYFIDHYHPDNGVSHSGFVKRMVMEIAEVPQFDPNFQRYEIDIKLNDHTVGYTSP